MCKCLFAIGQSSFAFHPVVFFNVPGSDIFVIHFFGGRTVQQI